LRERLQEPVVRDKNANNPEVLLLRASILWMLLVASFATEEGSDPDLKALVL